LLAKKLKSKQGTLSKPAMNALLLGAANTT
jgi:hypothetical protein